MAFVCFGSSPALAASLREAEITRIQNKVDVVRNQQPSPAKVNETIGGDAAVLTGNQSRAELVFNDRTVTRLGANTVFSFTNGTRDMSVDEGTILLQVPKGAGGANVRTAAITAAVTGTTVLIENVMNRKGRKAYSKWIVLEGEMRVAIEGRLGESMVLKPGQMIILPPNAQNLPKPVSVDIRRLMKSSGLVRFGEEPLEESELDSAVEEQDQQKTKGSLIESNLVILGKGTKVVLATEELINLLSQRTDADEANITAQVQGTRRAQLNKYAPPVTITNPNPYVINSTTRVITDPFIITNGIEREGTIYRTTDGLSVPQFYFGNTTPIDNSVTANAIYNTLQSQGEVALFRFLSLTIQNTFAVDTFGGPTALSFVGVNSVNVPGSVNLAGTGLNLFSVLTTNGPINVSGDVTFSPSMTGIFFARGSDGFLTVGGSILGANNLTIAAERDLLITGLVGATSLTLASEGITSLSGSSLDSGIANLTVNTQTLNLNGNLVSSSTNGVFNIGSGGINAVGANIVGNHVINIAAGGNMNIADLTALVLNLKQGDVTAETFSVRDVNINGSLQTSSIVKFPSAAMTPDTQTYKVNSISPSTTMNFKGEDSPVTPGKGGILLLEVGDFAYSGSANFRGGSGGNAQIAGDGGLFSVKATTGNINITGTINASSGDTTPASGGRGAGGAVSLVADSGNITVGGTVISGNSNSTTGGTVTIGSGMHTGTITVNNTAEISALLNSASVGVGGKIFIKGNGADININGKLAAGTAASGSPDRGSIEITNLGVGGVTVGPNANMSADIIKVGALGTAGVLTINQGSFISAGTQAKLYGGAVSGAVNFVGSGIMQINSPNTILRGHTISVASGLTVRIGSSSADSLKIYGDNLNFSNSPNGNLFRGADLVDPTATPPPTNVFIGPASAAPPF